jgi:MFS family permease
LAVLVILGGTVSTYVGNYMATFAIATLKFPPSIALAAAVVAGASMFACGLLGGWLADRFGRRPVMLAPRIALAFITWPLFLALRASPTPTMLFTLTAILNALTSISLAASLVAIPELFPRAIRATGLSIAYAVGAAVFGGTTQFIVTFLIGVTGDPTAPGWYVTLTSFVCIIAMWALPETKDRPLEL